MTTAQPSKKRKREDYKDMEPLADKDILPTAMFLVEADVAGKKAKEVLKQKGIDSAAVLKWKKRMMRTLEGMGKDSIPNLRREGDERYHHVVIEERNAKRKWEKDDFVAFASARLNLSPEVVTQLWVLEHEAFHNTEYSIGVKSTKHAKSAIIVPNQS